jgi:hypothetical protein
MSSPPPDVAMSSFPIVDPVLPDDFVVLLRLTGGPQNVRGTVNSLLQLAGSGGGNGGGGVNPMTALGDLIVGAAGGVAVRLPGSILSSRRFLTQTGTGTASNMPTWDQPSAQDLLNGTTGAGPVVLSNGPTINNPTIGGSMLFSTSNAPGPPAVGKAILWVDSIDKRLHDKNEAGSVGTTVIAASAPANFFVTGISSAGVISAVQPTAANLANGTTGSGLIVLQTAPTINQANLVGPQADSLNIAAAGSLLWNNDLGLVRLLDNVPAGHRTLKVYDPSDARTLGDFWTKRLELGQDPAYYAGAPGPGNYLHALRSAVAVQGDPDAFDKWETQTAYCNIKNLTRSSTTTNDFFAINCEAGIVDSANTFSVYQIFGGNFVAGTSIIAPGGGGNVTAIHGIYGRANHGGPGTISTARGVNGWARNSGPGVMVYAAGGNFTITNESGSSRITNCDVVAATFTTNGPVAGDAALFHAIQGSGGSGSVGNRYGVLIDDQATSITATKVYNFYSKGAARMNVIEGLLGVGNITQPTQPLESGGNIFVNAAVANLFLKDLNTGLQSAATQVITPQANNSIRSTNYQSSLVGWNISAAGNAEFNNVDVRGAIHAAVFVYNALLATAGTLGIFKSAAKLRTDIVITAAPVYGTTTFNLDAVDQDGLTHAASQLFAVGDILRLKDGLAGDTWFKVTAASDQTTFWRYTATIQAGSNNCTYRAGLAIADYGQTGQGFIIATADQTNAPFLQMATHSATFSSVDSSGTLTVTPQLRIGNLNGSFGYAADVYGFGAGQYGVAGQSWVTVDSANGVRIGNNVTTKIALDPTGNASFSGSITATTGTIAGWTIAANALTSGNGKTILAANLDPAGDTAWFGQAASGYRGWRVADSSGRSVAAICNAGAVFPYFGLYDGVAGKYRVVIGGLNQSFNSGDASTNSVGMKIWASDGTKLAEFSDAQNWISGWSISATALTKDTGTNATSAGMAPADFPFYAGATFANRAAAPFRVTPAGAMTASSGLIGGWTITAQRLSASSIVLDPLGQYIALGFTPPTSFLSSSGFWVGPKFPFASFWKLDNTSDLIGGRTLTNTNATTFGGGKIGNAAHFIVANNQSLSVAMDAGLQPTGNWFLSCWVKRGDLGTQAYTIASGMDPNANGWIVRIEGHQVYLYQLFNGVVQYPAVSAGAIADQLWHFVCFWFDTTDNKIRSRLDAGAVLTEANARSPWPTLGAGGAPAFYIGAQAPTGGNNFDGDIDALGYAKLVPTTGQLDTLFNAGAGTETVNVPALHLGTVNAGALTAGLSWDGATLNVIGAITATSGAINGPLTVNGPASALAIGNPPPTSAIAGSGIWLDRTGFYALGSSAQVIKIDATNGRMITGNGNVTIDRDGISLLQGTGLANRLQWRLDDVSKIVLSDLFGTTNPGPPPQYITNLYANSNTGNNDPNGMTFLTLAALDWHTGGGAQCAINVIANGPTHTRPNEQKIHLTWIEAASPLCRGCVVIGEGLNANADRQTGVALEIRSNYGVLLPRMTTATRDANVPTVNGMLIYNTTTNKFQGVASGVWADLN